MNERTDERKGERVEKRREQGRKGGREGRDWGFSLTYLTSSVLYLSYRPLEFKTPTGPLNMETIPCSVWEEGKETAL